MQRLNSPPADQIAAPPANSPVSEYLLELLDRFRGLEAGEVATYIPELAKANPDWFSICITTVDGKTYSVGDWRQSFTIQSISKPLIFALALEDSGSDAVMQRVGVEPTGEAFNSIVLDQESNRPYNPMVNAGAIATTSLIKATTAEEREGRVLEFVSGLANNELSIDEAVYRSELETGHRNRAIAHLMRNFDMLDGDVTPILDVYFRQCSILIDCRDLSMIGATFANGGVNPLSGNRIVSAVNVRNVLSVMGSCGMYDFAGEWAYEVGMPAKSGVSGGILAVLPGQLGIGVFSPRVDPRGNSARGIQVCRAISDRFGLHQYDAAPNTRSIVRREYRASAVSSRRVRAPKERDFLEQEGDRILVAELQGLMFFGAAERLLRTIEDRIGSISHLVLDFARVYGIEQNAASLLVYLRQVLAHAGVTLLVSSTDRNSEVQEQLEKILLAEDTPPGTPVPKCFADVYSALEQAEQALLAEAPETVRSARTYALKDLDLFKGLSAEELRALENAVLAMNYPAGATIWREGDPAQAFFVLASGSVSVRRRLPDSDRYIQLASFGPGVAFGEMALMDQGNRSADVCTEEPIICYALSMERLDEMSEQYPNIRLQLLRNIAQELAGRLRRANDEIAALIA